MSVKVKKGDKVELIHTDDSMTKLVKGAKGVVEEVEDDQDLIWVKWENGEKLALLNGIDKFKVLKE